MTSVHGYVQALDYSFARGNSQKKIFNPDQGTISDVLKDHPFMSIIELAGYKTVLGDYNGSFTIFVPINDIPSDKSIDVYTARNIVRYCILNTTVVLDVLKRYSNITPLLDTQKIKIKTINNETFLDNIPIIKSNVCVKNGIIHFIKTPLMPLFL